MADLNIKLSEQACRVDAALTKSEIELSSLHNRPSEAEQRMAQELEQMRVLIQQQKEENAQLKTQDGPMGAQYQLLLKQKEVEILQRQLEQIRTQLAQNQQRGTAFCSTNGVDEPSLGPRPILPSFSGSSEDHFDVWQQTLEDHFTYLNWGYDFPKRIAIIPTLLSGYALMTYRALKPQQLRSYETIMEALAERFSMKHKPPTAVLARLSRKQGASESVAEYAAEMIKRIQECGVTETATQIDHFVSNLRPDIKRHVLMQMPKSLMQCQQHAEAFEFAQTKSLDDTLDAVKYKPNYNRGRSMYKRNQTQRSSTSDNTATNSRSPSPDNEHDQNNKMAYRKQGSSYRWNRTPYNKQRTGESVAAVEESQSESDMTECDEDLNC